MKQAIKKSEVKQQQRKRVYTFYLDEDGCAFDRKPDSQGAKQVTKQRIDDILKRGEGVVLVHAQQ